MPTISFRDIEVQERESDLVGASFGRGFFVLDDYAPLREMSEAGLAEGGGPLPGEEGPALRAAAADRLGRQGLPGRRRIYVAPNPPFGAVFTYYLKDGVKSAAEARARGRGQARQGRQARARSRAGTACARRRTRRSRPSC
ncbi:MAG: hypothetical protein MZV63_66540 [Marinilabiliales bacterium]|nr:hypothetical protein [Marinilabiliales bacterium]